MNGAGNGNGKTAIPEASPQSRWIAAAFAKLGPGETLTYEEMDEAAGCDARDHRSYIQTAIAMVRREHGMIIECVRGVGYKRLPSDHIWTVGQHSRKRISNLARVAGKKLAKVDMGSLSDDAKRRHAAEMAHNALIRISVKPSVEEKIDKLVAQSTEVPSLAATIEALKS